MTGVSDSYHGQITRALGYQRGLNTTDSRTYSKNTTFAKAREFIAVRGQKSYFPLASQLTEYKERGPASSDEVDFVVGFLHTSQRNDDATG